MDSFIKSLVYLLLCFKIEKKWSVSLLLPDSVFDDLGLVGIVTTSYTRKYREKHSPKREDKTKWGKVKLFY